MTTFAHRLRELRTARSWSQKELAERAGVTVKAIGALERGERRSPYPHTVRALATALELADDERARLIAMLAPRGTSAHRTPPTPGSGPRSGLPGLPTAVVGRDGIVSALSEELAGRRHQLLTLTGPGGVGKTTVALMAAERVRDRFPGGVVLIELAQVDKPDGIVPAILRGLETSDTAVFDDVGLARLMEDRHLLLILDGIEHLMGWSTSLAGLLRRCPSLVVLATSRARLRLRDEREFTVHPLTHAESMSLFRERLVAAGGEWNNSTRAAVEILCKRSDGLPLAVELAASAAALFGPTALADRFDVVPDVGLRDLPTRQRTMDETITWSHKLLTDSARSLLLRLSVCSGTFSLSTVKAIGNHQTGTLHDLYELIEHSLVLRTANLEGIDRFRLLEPIRQDAAARLSATERVATTADLTKGMLEVIRGLADDLHTINQVTAFQLLEADICSIRLAVLHLIGTGNPALAAELIRLTTVFLAVRGYSREALTWLGRITETPVDDATRARVLVAEAVLMHHSDPATACARARTGLSLARRLADGRLAAEAATLASSTAFMAGDLPMAKTMLIQAEEAVARLDEPWLTTYVRLAGGQIALLAGQVEDSDGQLRLAEAAARQAGGAFEISSVLNARAITVERQGRLDEAAGLLLEALDLAVAVKNRWTLTFIVEALAGVTVRLGNPKLGTQLFAASASLAAEHHVKLDFPTTLDVVARDCGVARSRLQTDEFHQAWQAGRDSGIDAVLAAANHFYTPNRPEDSSAPPAG
ncbi:hypothetical protein GCM10028799_76540 [Kribbella italica]